MDILLALAGLLLPNTAAVTAQVTTCQWPHTCQAAPQLAQVTTCQWPHTCEAAPQLAQVTTCQWPNVCSVEGSA